MNKLDVQYQNLLKDILENGTKKQDRTGTGTLSVFGRQLRHDFRDGFPLLTTKRMAFKQIVTELIWFLRGDTNIKFLVDNDCHIWDGDALKAYHKHEKEELDKFTKNNPDAEVEFQFISKEEFINKIKTDDEFAKKWGDLGSIYGKQWREWSNYIKAVPDNPYDYEYRSSLDGPIDQIANLINDLKTNPDSRRLMVSAWNVGELDQMTLPPCHYGFQVYTRELEWYERAATVGFMEGSKDELRKSYLRHPNKEKYPFNESHPLEEMLDVLGCPTRAISLMFNMRSCDVPLGLPFNITSYGLLLEIIAKMVNMVPDELIGNLGDCHIYLNQIGGVKEQINREPYPLPKLVISNQVNFNEGIDEFLNSCLISDFRVEGYQSHPTIKMPLSN